MPSSGRSAKEFKDVRALIDYFESDDSNIRYAYRGQIRRSAPLIRTAPDGSDVHIETLFPADYRFFTHLSPDAAVHTVITRMREAGRQERDRFTDYIFEKAREGDAAVAWLRSHVEDYDRRLVYAYKAIGAKWRRALAPRPTNRADFIARLAAVELLAMNGLKPRYDEWIFRTSWSLAQHYCVRTCLLDLTHSARIAAWFATNPWTVNDPVPKSGTGVIYRFDLLRLESILEDLSSQRFLQFVEREIMPPPRFFIVDISTIPHEMARRPHNQQGLSLYGADQLDVLQYAFGRGAVEAFTFRHSSKPYHDPRSNRGSLRPENDPFGAVVQRFEAATAT